MKKIIVFVISAITILSFLPQPVEAASIFSGRIFLQVQDKGQAWYVYPPDSKRYYLGRPADAFDVMRKLGLGISEKDFYAAAIKAPRNVLGRIILRVQDKGQAYYVDPVSGRLSYLGRPIDAFNIMRSHGEGITNADLDKIASGSLDLTTFGSPAGASVTLTPDQKLVQFSWKYKNKTYKLDQILSKSLYTQYQAMPRVLTYNSDEVPANLRDSFYAMFLVPRSGDDSLTKILAELKRLAQLENISGDDLTDFVMAFVQYIPYDTAKAAGDNKANYLYETLYRNMGVCSDKSFLALALLRQLGYGASILDFPDSKHSAVGISCPRDQSTSASGYCYTETTSFFPIGAAPQSFVSGQAESIVQFDKVFDTNELGKMEIYQENEGKIYQNIINTREQVEVIKKLAQTINESRSALGALSLELATDRTNLDNMLAQLEVYKNGGDWTNYNSLVVQYNAAAKDYNDKATNYQLKIDIYNTNVREYNSLSQGFYQQN